MVTEKDSLIPVKNLSSYLNVRLVTPYPLELYAPVQTWQKAWRILKLDEADTSIQFVRDVPRVYIYLNNPSSEITDEADVTTAAEKRRKPAVKYKADTGSLFATIPYTDEEADTPQRFAKSASKRLAAFFPRLPYAIYQGSGLKTLEKYIHLSTQSIYLKTLLAFEISRTLFLEQNALSHALTDYAMIYLGLSTIKFFVLHLLYKQALKQNPPDEAEVIFNNVAKWPFPVFGLTDALVPATLFHLYSLAHKPLIIAHEKSK